MKEWYNENSVNKLSDSILGYDSRNDRINVYMDVLGKFAPAILSSLFTILSAITSSVEYGFSLFLFSSSLIIATCFSLGLVFYAVFSVIAKMQRIIGVEVWRNVKDGEKNEGAFYIVDSYKPIYEENLIKSIKSAFSELSEFAFVIIFPGGITDILIGIAENSPVIRINGTNQIELGMVIVLISILFLLNNIIKQVKETKHKVDKRRKEMRSYMHQIIEKLEKYPHFKVLFDSDYDSMD